MNIKTLMIAATYAAEKHSKQRRMNKTKEPYINHCLEVCNLVTRATEGTNLNLSIGALLHDVIEDTSGTYEEISALFGKEVAILVSEVTDDKSLPKEVRKELQVEHMSSISDNAKLLKIADKISNIRELVNDPPTIWGEARVIEYYKWAHRVVSPYLYMNEFLERQYLLAYTRGQLHYNF